jgi:hypothetical protein
MTLKQMMMLYHNELDRLFVQNDECNLIVKASSRVPCESLDIRELCVYSMNACLFSDNAWAERHRRFGSEPLFQQEASVTTDRMPLFVLEASGNDVPLSVIYHLMSSKECAWFVEILVQ